jgi:hypothetical protein
MLIARRFALLEGNKLARCRRRLIGQLVDTMLGGFDLTLSYLGKRARKVTLKRVGT